MTVFYHHNPLLYETSLLGLSLPALQRAYDNYGKLHVIDATRTNFVTIAPRSEHPSHLVGVAQPRYAEAGLASFVDKVNWFERHFGVDAAVVAFGRPLSPRSRPSVAAESVNVRGIDNLRRELN